MTEKTLITDAKNTWCPGCGNFTLQFVLKDVFLELEKEGVPPEELVLVTGIGCHAKMADYLEVNSVYAIHGRTIPVATGLKIANPRLKVICCAGDGDAYAEGLDHLIFGAKRNVDISVIIHNNRVYGLTTGQYTPTSPLGFRGKSTPAGTLEYPLNPMELMLCSGATFLARGYTRKKAWLKESIKEAILHPGFSFVDVLQICATFYDVHEEYDKRVYQLEGHDPGSWESALQKAREWDYNNDGPIGLGTFYQKKDFAFDQRLLRMKQSDGEIGEGIHRILNERR
jgi:2-oxoglutarate ferredoxin oxidoreductase subunit beta